MHRKLILASSATAIVYTLQLLAYGSAFFPHPLESGLPREVLSWATVVALLSLYWLGYHSLTHLRSDQSPTRVIVLGGVAFAILTILTFPFHSTDVFVYVAGGWEQAHYQLSPYTHVFRDIPDVASDSMIVNPWLSSSTNPWMDQPFTYGFGFALLSRLLAWSGQGHWALTVFAFQAVNLAAYSATALLLWSLARRLGYGRPEVLLYLFMWSPLILVHHLANAHNDLLIGLLLLIVGWAFAAGALFWVLPLLVLAGFIKYVGFILLPTAIAHIVKCKGWRYAVWSLAAALVLALAIGAPYFSGLERIKVREMLAQMTNTKDSLYAFLYYSYRLLTRLIPVLSPTLETFAILTRSILWFSYFLFLIYRIGLYVRKVSVTAQDAILECGLQLAAVIGIVSSQFYAWYIGMVFPLLLLIPVRHWLWRAGVIASCLHLLSLTSLMRKGIGYFVLTTMLALVCTWLMESRSSPGATTSPAGS